MGNYKADFDILNSLLECNDTENITLSLAHRSQVDTCPVLPRASETRQPSLPAVFHASRAPAAIRTVCERMRSFFP